MESLICPKCGKQFNKKYNYTVHLNRKFSCDNVVSKRESKTHTLQPTLNIKCSKCDAAFSRNSSLQRHMNNNCLMIQKEIEQEKTKQEILNEILEEMAQIRAKDTQISEVIIQIKDKCDKLEEENKDLKDKMTQIGNKKSVNKTYINANVTNNITNIQLIAFGQEKLDKIVSEECCRQILFRGFEAVPTLIKYVHFNKKKPEYHNCYISNTRDNHAITYDGIKWNLVDLQDIIDTLRENSHGFLEDKYETYGDTLNEQTTTKFGRYLKEKESEAVLKRYKETIKLLLYNNKDVVIQTRQMDENNKKLKNANGY